MTLIFPKGNTPPVQPGVHALIAGVSYYEYLPGGKGLPLANPDFDLRQLDCAALSAWNIYQWLLNHQDKLPLPLSTVRLLLSPSDGERQLMDPVTLKDVEPCTFDNFLNAANDWREDAAKTKESMTLFYFAGHGVKHLRDNDAVLMEDFGKRGPWSRTTLATENLYYGMAPSANFPEMAEKQVYFYDACRNTHPAFSNYDSTEFGTVLQAGSLVNNGPQDRRNTSVFLATVPGDYAYGLPQQGSFFSQALLKGLNGEMYAEHMECTSELGYVNPKIYDGEKRWVISTRELFESMKEEIARLLEKWGKNPDALREDGSRRADIHLHILDMPPLVPITLSIHPPDAHERTRVRVNPIREDDGTVDAIAIWDLPKPIQPHPYEDTLPAGSYCVRGIIETEDPNLEPQFFIAKPGEPKTFMVRVKQ